MQIVYSNQQSTKGTIYNDIKKNIQSICIIAFTKGIGIYEGFSLHISDFQIYVNEIFAHTVSPCNFSNQSFESCSGWGALHTLWSPEQRYCEAEWPAPGIKAGCKEWRGK